MRSMAEHAAALTPREAGTALDALCLLLSGSDLREADPLVRAAASAMAVSTGSASFSRATIAAGVSRGTKSAFQPSPWKSGMPASAAVGMSGRK